MARTNARRAPRGQGATGTAHARAALAGNPSDGYGGAVLAVTLGDYQARASARRAQSLAVIPPSALVEATVRRFARELDSSALSTEIEWSTSIPQGVGLGGSSAIVIATLRALSALHGATLTPAELAAFALAVETNDLGIVAGLQDRVAQAFGGLTFMDFHPRVTTRDGHGHYETLSMSLLSPILIAWRTDAAEDSGAVHSSLRERFERGEPVVVDAMAELAEHARRARQAIQAGDRDKLAGAVDASFDARRRMMPLNPRHVEMIHAARASGASANYTGSGGAIVAVCRDEAQRDAVTNALTATGCRTLAPLH